MITISQLKTINSKELSNIDALLSQLGPNEKSSTAKELREALAQNNFIVLVAKEKGQIVGMASIYFIRLVSGWDVNIEDVVVDVAQRGKGIGKQLTQRLINLAKRKRVRYIDLTSKPSRIVANELYKKLGFERRETNVYRLYLAG